MRKPVTSNQSALALIITILILVTLVAIAIPFVISMIYKEKITKNTFYQTQTRLGALSARNHAISLLIRSHSFYELAGRFPAPFDTPDYDTPQEFKIDFDAYGFSSAIEVTNPKGYILGCEVQDEQGKINIKTAPPAALSNLKAIIQPTSKDIADFITEYSSRASNWVAPVQLRGYERLALINGREVHRLYVDRSIPSLYFTDRARIQVSCGKREFLAYVSHVSHDEIDTSLDKIIWCPYASQRGLMIDRIVPKDLLTPQSLVEVEQRHPININTASREVLMANLINVGRRNVDDETGEITHDDRITSDQAQMLTELIKAQVFKEPDDYLKFLTDAKKQEIIDARQYRNLLFNGTSRRYSYYDEIENKFAQTLPFCFRSGNTYRLLATGILNYPSGTQAAQVTSGEVVDLEPPGIVLWRLASQYDFDRAFETPYGNPLKLITYPRLTGLTWPTQPYVMPDPDVSQGSVKLRTAEDKRGSSIIKSEHFPNTHEGKSLSGSPLSYNSKDIFTFRNNRDIPVGGIEMWVRLESLNPPVYFFDIRQDEYENRLSLYYTGGELILQVADATLARQTAQIRAALTLRAQTWYHLGAYWKGTKYAQLALFVDGFPVGSFAHYDASHTAIITELSSELTGEKDTPKEDGAGLIVPVVSTGPFPAQGVIQVGEEAIEYEAKTAQGFRVRQVWDRAQTPPVCIYKGRGARGSQIKSHPTGVKVTLYGYANTPAKIIKLRGYPSIKLDRLTTGGARLIYAIPAPTPSTTIFKPLVTNVRGDVLQEAGITADDTQIPTNPDTDLTAEGFPPEGYLKIENEVVFYKGIETMQILDSDGNKVDVPCFTDCQRGTLETTPASHKHKKQMSLYSIKVTTNLTGYPDPTLIQIGDEWLGPFQKVGTNYFTGIIKDKRPLGFYRGFRTAPASHRAGALLIPVFALKHPYAGAGDTVTIIEPDQARPKEERTIKQAHRYRGQYLFAFTKNLSREYPLEGQVTRLLKFPSDELPSYLPDTLAVGEFTGLIDEIKFFRISKGNFRLNGALASGGSETEIQMNGVGGLPTSGIIKVGDEIIGYADKDQKELRQVQRGYLNTPRPAQDPDQRAFNLSHLIPVSSLAEAISARANVIPLSSRRGLMGEGYLLVDDEVMGYCWRRGGFVSMPANARGIGLYRGAFGTDASSHNVHSLAYAIPFRYWDRSSSSGGFDTTMAYFRASTRVTDAIWHRVRWDEVDRKEGVGIKILVRLDSKPTWATVPTNQPGGLFVFNSPSGNNLINVKADEIEILVVFPYYPGAFETDDWKHSPMLSGIRVEYERKPATLTMYHLEE